MRTMRVVLLVSLVLLLGLPLAGCRGGRDPALPPLVKVQGVVTLDGQPESRVAVTFIPVGSTRGGRCHGFTNDSGAYELVTEQNEKGAAVGEYKVLCNKWVQADGSDFPRDSKVSPIEAGGKEKFPPRYSQEETTELTANVPAGGGSVDFKLTTKR